jgi:hypothetical protein
MWLLNWLENCRLEKKLSRLSKDAREEILTKSPYEAVPFQGEGYHVFLKNNPDYYEGYVATIGEVSPKEADDWIIKRFWNENGEI